MKQKFLAKKGAVLALATVLAVGSFAVSAATTPEPVFSMRAANPSGGSGGSAASIKDLAVSLNPSTGKLEITDETPTPTLTATVTWKVENIPEKAAADIKVVWGSTNRKVLEVQSVQTGTTEATATVTGVAAGTAYVTVSVGDKSAQSKEITVTDKRTKPVESITLNKTELTLAPEQTEKLTATVTPEDATDKTVTWSTDNDQVATVAADGTVTAVAAGTATVTAKAGDKAATCTVTVTAPETDEPGTDEPGDEKPAVLTGVTVNPTTLTMKPGEEKTLSAAPVPAAATGVSITMKSSDDKFATVANNVVKAVADGKATITVTAKQGDVTKTATCEVTVTTPVESVTLDQTELVIGKDQTKKLNATVTPDTASDKTVAWTSSDAGVATVDAEGNVKGVKAGEATITAKAGDKTAECKVTVAEVTLNATSMPLQKGKSTTALKIASQSLASDTVDSWVSDTPSIATVDAKGKVKGVAVGSATVTVTMKSGATASCDVTVQKGKVKTNSISLSAKKLTLATKQSETLTVTRDPISATDKITWTSSNKKVATVNKNGKITAKKAGKATITAKTANGKKATCKVTVKDPTVKLQKTKATIKVGKSTTIEIKSTFPANDKVKSFKSANKKIATVNKKGVVTGKKAGTTKITVTMKSGAKATFNVTVKKK